MNNTDIIKDKLNILDVVGSYVKLEKAGKTYKGKSPFTNEKTPSFFVSPEKGFFYCFSSGKGGDIFTFIQEMERIDFPEAMAVLAEKAGVSLDNKSSQVQHEGNARLYTILDEATRWYEVQLRKNPEVVTYLTNRGLTKETIIKFRLGFARDSWLDIYEYLTKRKHADTDIVQTGMIIKKEQGGYYDRFRSRVMFPLMDTRGRVVGFSGRIYGPETEKSGAKYVNSPEGPLFDKSKVLYGYHTAKTAIAKAGYCILVEGQFDVLLAQQSGYVNTVAISGTGLTDDHIAMIHRFTDTVLLALDSDKAGIKATRRSVIAAYRHGIQVKVIVLPEGMDPADVIAKSKEQWDVCVSDATDYIDYRLEIFNRTEHSFEEKKNLVESDLFTFVTLIKSAVVQDRVLQKIALFLGVTVDAVRSDFVQFKPEQIDPVSAVDGAATQESNNSNLPGVEDSIYYLWDYITEKSIDIDPAIMKNIIDIHQDLYDFSLDEGLAKIDMTQRNVQQFVYESRYKDTSPLFFGPALLAELVHKKIKNIDQKSKKVLSEIRQAEGAKDNARLAELINQNQTLLVTKTELKKLII